MRPLLCGLLLTLAIFGMYELAEWRWLPRADSQAVHLLHVLRGVISSLVVAAAVGWIILRNSPAFLAEEPSGEAWAQPPTPVDRARMYARWFIAMRWIAVLLAGVLVFISVKVVHWLPAEVWWPLAGTVAALAGFNVVYAWLLRWEGGLPRLLVFQGYADVMILIVLLHFSGGIENPLSMVMIFHVILGGILLSRRQCYCLAITASTLLAVLTWAECYDVVGHYTLELFPHFHAPAGEVFHPARHTLYAISWLALQAVVLFLTSYFVTSLSERLRENERRLQTMADHALAGQQLLEQSLETTGTGLRVLGGEFQAVWANRLWKEWFERPGRGADEDPTTLKGLDSPARLARSDRQIRVTEVGNGSEALEPGEHARVFQVTTAPLPHSGGNIQQIVQLAQEVTLQKQAQTQMLRAGRLAAVGKLAGQVAHEVNNPIAIISAKSRLLLSDHREEISSKVAEELGKITDLSDRVARIAQGLLSYCRPSPATRNRLDLRQPIRKSLAMVEQHTRKLGVMVHDELPESLPSAHANAPELEQVFLNLFLNALDAMPAGGELTISGAATVLADEKAAVAITVQDTGCGIPKAIRDRIFEPFFTTKQDGHGTGLGLCICLGLVRSHGGEIEVESDSSHGSRFTVKLPVTPASTKGPGYG